jgi:hypothetical protein
MRTNRISGSSTLQTWSLCTSSSCLCLPRHKWLENHNTVNSSCIQTTSIRHTPRSFATLTTQPFSMQCKATSRAFTGMSMHCKIHVDDILVLDNNIFYLSQGETLVSHGKELKLCRAHTPHARCASVATCMSMPTVHFGPFTKSLLN